MYKRIVLKLSGEAIGGGRTFDNDIIDGIVNQIKIIIKKGINVSLVIGGGNFWRGRSANPEMDRCRADQIGMLATVMNALYMADFLKQRGIGSSVMTPFPVGAMTELFSKELAFKYFSENRVIIFAGGIGHPFFSTDTVTALRAAELHADAILYAKSIDGVYSDDPEKNPDAVKYDKISCKEIMEKNLKVIDIAAANLCMEQSVDIVLFGLSENNGIVKAAMGEKIGTLITAD